MRGACRSRRRPSRLLSRALYDSLGAIVSLLAADPLFRLASKNGRNEHRGNMTDQVVVTDDGAVRIIRMNRPEKKNALTQPMYVAMTAALHEAAAAKRSAASMIAGGPNAFSAGADIAEFLESAQSGGLRPKTVAFLHALARNRKTAGRRGRRSCGRHRHHHAAALRLRRRQRQRHVRDAVQPARR